MLSATRLVRTLHQRRDPFTRLYRSFHSHTDPRVEKAVYVTNERGSNVIHDPLLSKGTAFTIDERERLAIRGLLPSRHQEMGKQLLRVKRNLDACPTPLSKYIYLAALHDRNETLYYKLLMKHMNELASIVYTPTGKKKKLYLINLRILISLCFLIIQQWERPAKSLTLSIVDPVVCIFQRRIKARCLPWSITGHKTRSTSLLSQMALVSWASVTWEQTACRFLSES